MKKYLLITFLHFLFSFSNAQQNIIQNNIFPPIGDAIHFVNCNLPPVSGCNKIHNPGLNTNSSYDNNPYLAFNNGYIDGWSNSHGTPSIETTSNLPQAPPFPGIHAAYMGFAANNPGGEGIAGKINQLIANKPYSISFFEAILGVCGSCPSQYNIYLMHCADAQTYFNPMSYNIPTPPPHSQQIYCKTNFDVLAGWRQVALDFIPNENYDMIWIFPNIPNATFSQPVNINFSYPEIISTENFTAGPPPAPTPGNCIITIGPSTPNACTVKNAVFTWTGPNGQVRAALPNQQLDNINTTPGSLDIGVWTLHMKVPTAENLNNICSSTMDVKASVVVPPCIATCPPQILSSSYFDRSTCGEASQSIIPYTFNYYCIPWECGGSTHLESNIATGNEWYVNDILITGNGGHIPGIGYVSITNNSKNLYHTLSTFSNGNQLFKFQLKNTSQGCQQLTSPTQVFYGETFFPGNNFTGWYKPNFNITISTPRNYNVGPGTIYTWSIPNTILTDLDNMTPEVNVYFPSNIPIPKITGTLTVTNSLYCNGTYPIYFEYNPNAFAFISETYDKNEKNNISIYPNPTSAQITITSKASIQYIELIPLFGLSKKSIKGNSMKVINITISDLKPGIYNCKVTTAKGVENQRLVIK